MLEQADGFRERGGAVGGYAVQLARQARATMTATGSARSTDRIRSYGADQVIDYTATPLLQAVAGQRFDVVLNLVPTSPEETATQLGELVARVDAGDLKIDVAQRRRLTDLPAVHDQAAAGQLPGKTILTP